MSRPILIPLFLAAMSADAVVAQQSFAITPFAGLGAGPAGGAAIGVQAGVGFGRVVIRGEYSYWESWGACAAIWPNSARCDVSGQTVQGGAAFVAPLTSRIGAFAEVLAGGYVHTSNSFDGVDPTLAGGLGVRVRLLSALRGVAGVRHMRVWAEAYEDLLEEPLRYTVGTLGVSVVF